MSSASSIGQPTSSIAGSPPGHPANTPAPGDLSNPPLSPPRSLFSADTPPGHPAPTPRPGYPLGALAANPPTPPPRPVPSNAPMPPLRPHFPSDTPTWSPCRHTSTGQSASPRRPRSRSLHSDTCAQRRYSHKERADDDCARFEWPVQAMICRADARARKRRDFEGSPILWAPLNGWINSFTRSG